MEVSRWRGGRARAAVGDRDAVVGHARQQPAADGVVHKPGGDVVGNAAVMCDLGDRGPRSLRERLRPAPDALRAVSGDR